MTTHRSFTPAADGAIPKIDKDPQDVLDYEIGWNGSSDPDLYDAAFDFLGRDDNGDPLDTITGSEFFRFDSEGVEIDPMDTTAIDIDSDSNTTTTATVWLSKGVLGQVYTITNRITTAGGRTKDQSFTVRIKKQ